MKRFFIITCSSLFFVFFIFLFVLLPAFGSSDKEESGYLPILVKQSSCVYPTEEPWPPDIPTRSDGTVPTPPPPPTPAPSECGDVRIINIHYYGSGSQEPDEYVEIRNFDDSPILLQDWLLQDKGDHQFTFPSFLLEWGRSCRIYTNEIHPEWCGFSFESINPIWNNDGDCAHLYDSFGNPTSGFCY